MKGFSPDIRAYLCIFLSINNLNHRYAVLAALDF